MDEYNYVTYRMDDDTHLILSELLERMDEASLRDALRMQTPVDGGVTVCRGTHEALRTFFESLTLDDVHRAFGDKPPEVREHYNDKVFQFYFLSLLPADKALNGAGDDE